MDPQRFWIHLTIGLTVSMALSVANLVSGGDAKNKKNQGREGLPPDREASSPLQGPSKVPKHMPSTGQTNNSKPKTASIDGKRTLQPGGRDHDTAAGSMHPSSHAEKHPDYDRVDAENKKALDKESH